MSRSVARFGGIAELYDRVRPTPPEEIVRLVTGWRGAPADTSAQPLTVVDLGAGTGLSTALWAGRAARVVGVEPSARMRAIAERRLAALDAPPGTCTVVDATAEDTGLPDGFADVVTASQALHWFDPARVLPEAARVLRPGGVFAAFDCDWPPCIDAETDAAYAAFHRASAAAEARIGTRPAYAEKEGHLERLRSCGLFRFATEACVHKEDEGDAERLVGIALSQGGTPALLAAGVGEDAIGLTGLREVAARRLPVARKWWWTYRVRLAVT